MDQPIRSIHVVAGVITDARGRVLLARRSGGRDMAGLWEFPGGKREAGETSEAALVRELREELGIEAEVGEALIEVPQLYPDKRLRLEVRRITGWKGAPRGHEGQALAWVAPDRLTSYAMPPADRPVVGVLLHPDRYLVTPEPAADDEAWLSALERALGAGAARVQLRMRQAAPARMRSLAERAIALCRRAGADVLLNGDAQLARELGIGVHLRATQLREAIVRPLPKELPVAASCHDAGELKAAQRIGCDFAVLGPVRETATHPGADALGWESFAALREAVSLPIYAIGGLSPADITAARGQGAQGIAAIRSLWPA
ncbi:Nudix family hydrolase [Pseudoxanthomonas sangjuensis]